MYVQKDGKFFLCTGSVLIVEVYFGVEVEVEDVLPDRMKNLSAIIGKPWSERISVGFSLFLVFSVSFLSCFFLFLVSCFLFLLFLDDLESF